MSYIRNWLLWHLASFRYICNMANIDNIKSDLLRIKPYLVDKYHISSIGLFGSVVRDDFSPTISDIDIIVDFEKPIGIEFIDLADYLENELNKKVDLVSKRGIKAKYYDQIKREIIYV
jgi:predicted nucleotidyltransferase